MIKRTKWMVALTALLAVIVSFGLLGCDSDSSTEEGYVGNGGNNDPITVVWYPNESSTDYEPARDEFGRLITEAT